MRVVKRVMAVMVSIVMLSFLSGIAAETTEPSDAPYNAAGIDYGAADVIITGTVNGKPAPGYSINLTNETLTVPAGFVSQAYSIDGGEKWKNKPLTDRTLSWLFNRGFTLALTDQYDRKTRQPLEDAAVVSFARINGRSKLDKYDINYQIGADQTGMTPGTWVLTKKKGETSVKAGMEVAVADGWYPDENGFGRFYGENKSPNGIPVSPLNEKGKPQKTKYFIRNAARDNGDGTYTAASKAKKISVKGQQKSRRYSVNKKRGEIKYRANTYVVTDDGAELMASKGELDISDYDGDVYLWSAATANAPAAAVTKMSIETDETGQLLVAAEAAGDAAVPIVPAAAGDIYTVTFSVTGGNGTLSANVGSTPIASADTVDWNKTVTFTAVPDSNYCVKQWKDNGIVVSGNKTNTYTITNIAAGHNVTVEFEQIAVTFNIVDSAGAPVMTGGTLSAKVDGIDIVSGDNVDDGKTVIFTALPDTGYIVKEWKDNGVVVSGNKSSTYRITNIKTVHTVTAEFVPIHAVTFGVTGSNGTLSAKADSTSITSPATVEEGKEAVFTAVPASGYRVKAWQDNGVVVNGTNLTYTITNISADHTVTVEFEMNTVTFGVTGSNGTLSVKAGSTVIPNSPSIIAVGTTVTFTAAPDDEYRVKQWTDNGVAVEDNIGGAMILNKTNTFIITNMGKNHTVTVEFELIPKHEVQFSAPNGVNLGVTIGTISAKVGGTAIPSGTLVTEGKDVLFTAAPTSGWCVKEWVDNGKIVTGNKTNTYTLNIDETDHDVTVEFELIVVKYSPTAGGTLTATMDGSSIPSGQAMATGKSVLLAAAPDTGYRVKEWTVNGAVVNGTNPTYTITNIATVYDVKVVFEAIPAFAVTFNVIGGNGTLTARVDSANVTSGAPVIEHKNVVFTAVPNTGYRVKEWKDNGGVVNGTNLTYTVSNLAAAHSVTVEFEAIAVTYSVTTANGTLGAAVDGTAITSGSVVATGKSVVFTAVPDAGYRVKQWRDNGTIVNGTNLTYTISNITAAHTVTVEFEVIPTYAVAYSVTTANGTLAATMDGLPLASGTLILAGKNIAFTAVPGTGYRVKEWTDNGVKVNGTNLTYALSNIDKAHTVTVEFEVIPTYIVAYSVATGNGTLAATMDGAALASGSIVTAGKTLVFTAAADSGYRVKEWTDNGVKVNGTNLTYMITNIAAAHTVTVEFEIPPAPTPTPAPTAPGTSSTPAPTATPAPGTSSTPAPTATPAPGTSNNTSGGNVLPQTGMLIWPIPLLAAFGILIITFGQILKHKKAKIGRSIGTSIIYVGGIALLISAGLTTYNLLDANRAATSAKQSSQVLSERISQSKGIPAAENAEENEQEPVDNTLPLVKIDRERYIGMLSIPALSLELPINNDWSDTKLKESPCRYAGDLSGSLVICAHNYKAHFGGISSLAYGDTVLITDALGEEHEYTVVTVTRLSETDIDGMVNSPYDLTLFTCPSIGAERVAVRCTKVSP